MSKELGNSTITAERPAFSGTGLLIGYGVSIGLTLLYILAIRRFVKADTRRWLFLTAYCVLLIGAIGGWIAYHGNILEVYKHGVGDFMLIPLGLFMFGAFSFLTLLLQSHLQVFKSQRPHIVTHLLAIAISTAFTIGLVVLLKPESLPYFDIAFGIFNGYVCIVGARLLYIAVTSTSLSIIKKGKLVGKLMKKEDGEWVEVENELVEEAPSNGICCC